MQNFSKSAAHFNRSPQPLHTPRIALTPIVSSDGPELWSVVDSSRAHLARWLPWIPLNSTPEASQRFANACEKDWHSHRALRWAIRARHTGTMLGIVGLEQWIHATRSCNLGYWLSRDASGAGLMTEAAAACLRYAFDEAGIHRVQCAAATKNRRSLAVISRLGFLPEGIARQAELVQGKWLDHAIFGKLSTD